MPAKPAAVNTEGMKRRGFASDEIMAVRRAYKALFRKGLTLEEAVASLADDAKQFAAVQSMIDFLDTSERGIIR